MERYGVLTMGCVLTCLISGCAEELGTDAYAMWERYESPEYAYVFSYLSPPWELVDETDDGGRQLIAVEPKKSSIDYAVESGNLHARIKAVVEVIHARSPSEAAWEDAERYRGASAISVEGPRSFKSANGIVGVRIDATFSDRRVVAIYHGLAREGAISMKAAGDEELDTPDMVLFLKGLEPDPRNERE